MQPMKKRLVLVRRKPLLTAGYQGDACARKMPFPSLTLNLKSTLDPGLDDLSLSQRLIVFQ